MYGLETLEGMNNREMKRYHKEQRRKKDAIRGAIDDGIIQYFAKGGKCIKNIDLLLNCINKETDKLDLENQESL